MTFYNSFVCLLVAAFCLAVPVSYGFTFPDGQKCAADDNDCAGKKFTYIVQHTNEYPELNVPNLEPYRPPVDWILTGISPLNYEIKTLGMKFDGFKNLVVKEFSGFSSISESINITAKLTVPKVNINMNFIGRVSIPVVGDIKPEAILSFELSDVEMPVTFEGDFEQRDGKSYFHLKNADSKLHVSGIKSEVSVEGGWFKQTKEKFWTLPMTKLMNLNWKLIKHEMDKDKEKFNVIIKDILTPILKQVAVQDIYQI